MQLAAASDRLNSRGPNLSDSQPELSPRWCVLAQIGKSECRLHLRMFEARHLGRRQDRTRHLLNNLGGQERPHPIATDAQQQDDQIVVLVCWFWHVG
jgi:hypothetical protein